jgi:transglutaminase-like putative cysteine protease
MQTQGHVRGERFQLTSSARVGILAAVPEMEEYLKPTFFIDCDSSLIKKKAQQLTAGREDDVEKAKSLFYFVRDEVRYNPYLPKYLREHFQASNILTTGQGYCVQKAVLLVALARAAGIPSRIGFAMIRNNLIPDKLYQVMRTNIYPWHGYAELYLKGKWVKATPTLDLKICQENDIVPVEFDGQSDAMLHLYSREGKLHIEYLMDRGPFDDVPLEQIREALSERGLLGNTSTDVNPSLPNSMGKA